MKTKSRTFRLKPTAGNVFILPDQEPESLGRIIRPAEYRNREMPASGHIFAMGGKLTTRKGVVIEPEFKIGDHVIFRKYSGLFCDVGGKRLIQIKQHDVEALDPDLQVR